MSAFHILEVISLIEYISLTFHLFKPQIYVQIASSILYTESHIIPTN